MPTKVEDSDSVELTEMPPAYTGHPCRLQITGFSKGINDQPGVYLQHVEGCGYTVYELTPEQARNVAKLLIDAADKTEKEFKK